MARHPYSVGSTSREALSRTAQQTPRLTAEETRALFLARAEAQRRGDATKRAKATQQLAKGYLYLVAQSVRRYRGSVDTDELLSAGNRGLVQAILPHPHPQRAGVSERKQLEVDFVCNLGSAHACIQFAYRLPTPPEKRELGLHSLRSVNDAFAQILITAEPEPRHYGEHGILHLPLLDFLLHTAALPLKV